LAILTSAVFAQTGAATYEGRRITSIRFEPEQQPLTESEVAQKLPLHVGDTFHADTLRRAIQSLFASGRYADLAVDATKTPNGIALRFLTKPAYFVGRVVITGDKAPPNSGQLASATKLRLGARYLDTQRKAAADAIRDLLRENGFYDSHIDSAVRYDERTQSADLAFDIDPGTRARFSQPDIEGNPQRSPAALIRVTRWQRLFGLLGWQPVTEARVQQGLDRLRRDYEKKDRLEAKVTLERLDFDKESNRVKPILQLEAGPKIEVVVNGASVDRGELHQLMPVYQEQTVDDDLLAEGQRNLAQYLQAQGYYEASVTYKLEKGTGPKDRRIVYEVIPGQRHKFVHLEIRGNRYFSTTLLRERLYIQISSMPRFPRGRFSAGFLKQDIAGIQNLYNANGFRDAQVTARMVDNYNGRRAHLAVFLNIAEGSQWRVRTLGIDGISEQERLQLEGRLWSAAGQPFSLASLADDRSTILNYFFGRGFLNAAFEFFETDDEVHHEADLKFVVTRGKQDFVRGVVVSGLETTRPKVALSRIGLQKGAPLSITEETDSQRRLYDLGIFARVNTALQNPDGNEDEKYVLYDIDEARHYSLNLGLGAQIARIGGGATTLDNPAGSTGFAPRLAVGLSRINFLGRGQTLGLQTAVSTIDQKAALTYFIPQFGAKSNLSLTSTALIENSNDIRTYTAHRREASVQLGQRLSRADTLQYRMVFRDVSLSDLKINQLLVPLLSQPEHLGLAEFSLIDDRRDDPADSHRGVYSTVNISYAPSFLGSETSFGRALFRNSTYHPIHRDIVFARSTQFGIITRLAGGDTIPLAERLYSGGSTSLRSFPDFQAGPRDLQTGFVLGGNALFVNNLELRFPLYGDNLRAVLFEDAGNVYRTLGAMSFRFRQQNLQDFDYMVQSAGIGLRYQTPIGPLRLDFSLSPNAPRFFGLKGTLEDLENNTAVPTVQKINAFQFHISLGQAF
jgi:outer membrane protein assembly complex protein YaeT